MGATAHLNSRAKADLLVDFLEEYEGRRDVTITSGPVRRENTRFTVRPVAFETNIEYMGYLCEKEYLSGAHAGRTVVRALIIGAALVVEWVNENGGAEQWTANWVETIGKRQ